MTLTYSILPHPQEQKIQPARAINIYTGGYGNHILKTSWQEKYYGESLIAGGVSRLSLGRVLSWSGDIGK